MGSDTPQARVGLDADVDDVLGGELEQPGPEETPYFKSCYAYGHEPACASYHAHVTRLYHERIAAGGEAELKAKVKFWERLEGAK